MKIANIFKIPFTLCALVCLSESQWSFPNDFKFGVATSAYQIEGAWNESGKGVSMWDYITHTAPYIIQDGSNGDVACDSYHKWERDVEMVAETGVDFYRFSLSWTRIFPQGYVNFVNPAGVEYYNNLIDKLLENNIEPVVTLYHWDLPQIFSPLGSWSGLKMVDLYAHYARKAFELFGDRVKTWITFNEPHVFCQDFSVVYGMITPLYPNGVIEYLCTYNVLLAHAEAYHIYDKIFRPQQKGRISITLNFDWSESATTSRADEDAAEQRRQFEFGIYANPILNSDFPQIVKDRIANRSKLEGFPESRLPELTLDEKSKISGTYDFLGLNHYTTWLVEAAPEAPIGQPSYTADLGTSRFQPSEWPSTGADGNKVVPRGLRRTLQWIKQTYRNPEVLITECGYPDTTGTLDDEQRIEFLRLYMDATLQALHVDEVNVTGFTIWSLMDNLEWGQGYLIKYGLFNVDFEEPDRPRTAKNSVAYVRSVVETRQVDFS